ncbi:MAG: V-type ATPase subunit [Candidatus Sedimenticola endophacoides]
MPGNASQTYLTTRAAVLSRRLLDARALEEMLQRPLEQLAGELQLTELLESGAPEANINRAVERALIHALMLEFTVLIRPLHGAGRNTLVHWIRKFELYNLKALIRGKIYGHTHREIEDNLHDLPPMISLPHKQLLATEGVAELLRQLDEGHYSDIARQVRRVYEEKNEPFSLDAAIDQRYYTALLKQARATESADRDDLLRLIGTLIDHQNLMWLLRYRLNYNLPPTVTYYLLIPFGRQLQRDRLKQLVNLNTLEEVIDALPETLAAPLTQAGDIEMVRRRMGARTLEGVRHQLRYSKSALTRSLAYLVIREADLKKVFAIIQGRILNLDQEMIRQAAGIREGAHV